MVWLFMPYVDIVCVQTHRLEQTEEWKVWILFMLAMYYFFAAKEMYIAIRNFSPRV